MSAVLEFNYLKAPIGFFLLFVLPALLIGIAPSIVVDYGRLVAHTATGGESAIVLPVISLALIAIAWWIGRLLFEIAWENFWQLHYSLVLPVFVVLRELLRAMLEKFRGRAVTAEQLDHGRRVCAVIAALIFAGGGLAVAVSVEVSFGMETCRRHPPSLATCRVRRALQCRSHSWHFRRPRKPLLDLARALPERHRPRLGSRLGECRRVACQRRPLIRSAYRRRALRSSHGGRDRWAERQSGHPHRIAQAWRVTSRQPD